MSLGELPFLTRKGSRGSWVSTNRGRHEILTSPVRDWCLPPRDPKRASEPLTWNTYATTWTPCSGGETSGDRPIVSLSTLFLENQKKLVFLGLSLPILCSCPVPSVLSQTCGRCPHECAPGPGRLLPRHD